MKRRALLRVLPCYPTGIPKCFQSVFQSASPSAFQSASPSLASPSAFQSVFNPVFHLFPMYSALILAARLRLPKAHRG
eukprot:TRINITY_DN4516_c0_g1_i1.p2 TRINITY_DN4516_c0_g1~~TRINITY_DN4516_c0_g1_i1.p2  ORF type:complete len:78 (+),score=1.05 TRINITY_DN4516_c0_g1_i1:235-468(+)